MAFVLKEGGRVLCGHTTGDDAVRLRKEADPAGGANLTGEIVDNGEAVAVMGLPAGEFVFVSRQDGVKGFIRVQHLHVQTWPLRRPVLAGGWKHTFIWRQQHSGPSTPLTRSGSSWRVSVPQAPGEHVWQEVLQEHSGSEAQYGVRALSSHALMLFDQGSGSPGCHLLLLHEEPGGGTFAMLWDGSQVLGVGHAKEQAGSAPPPILCAGWEGVWTWAAHEDEARVGLQWAVNAKGRVFRRNQDPQPSAVRVLTSHSWTSPEDGSRVYLLDEPVGACVVWNRHSTSPSPHSPARAPADPSGLCIAWRSPPNVGDRFALRAGREVVCGNTAHNGGGTLLRKGPHESLDDANVSGVQVFDEDILRVLDVAGDGWCKVARVGNGERQQGEGWLLARNVHVQVHAGLISHD